MNTLKVKTENISLNKPLIDSKGRYLFNIDDETYFWMKIDTSDELIMHVCRTELKLPKKWYINEFEEPSYLLTKRNDVCELLKVILHIRLTGQILIRDKGLTLIDDTKVLRVVEKDVMHKYWGTNILEDDEYWDDMSEEEASERRRVWNQEKKDMGKEKRVVTNKYYDAVMSVLDKERLLWLRRFHDTVPEYIKLINDVGEEEEGLKKKKKDIVSLSPIDWSVYATVRGKEPRLGKTVRYATLLEYITRKHIHEEKREVIKAWLKEHPECNEYFSRMEFPPNLPPYEVVTPREIFKYWRSLQPKVKVKV